MGSAAMSLPPRVAVTHLCTCPFMQGDDDAHVLVLQERQSLSQVSMRSTAAEAKETASTPADK